MNIRENFSQMYWFRTEDLLPSYSPGEKVKVIFYSKDWETVLNGLFIFLENGSYNWLVRDQQNDAYYILDLSPPEFWSAIALPE